MSEPEFEWEGVIQIEGVGPWTKVSVAPGAVVRGLDGEVIGELTGAVVQEDGSIRFECTSDLDLKGVRAAMSYDGPNMGCDHFTIGAIDIAEDES